MQLWDDHPGGLLNTQWGEGELDEDIGSRLLGRQPVVHQLSYGIELAIQLYLREYLRCQLRGQEHLFPILTFLLLIQDFRKCTQHPSTVCMMEEYDPQPSMLFSGGQSE